MTEPDSEYAPVPVTTEVVEARLRATLHRRAADIDGTGTGAGVGVGVGVGGAAAGPAGRGDRRRRWFAEPRPWLGAAAAVIVVAIAVGITVAVWPDTTDDEDDVVTSAAGQDADGTGTGAQDAGVLDAAAPDSSEPSAGEGGGVAGALPVCGSTLPATITVPGAIDGPIDGPAPGRPEGADGELVVHWLRADGAIEARWPAPQQPLYGERDVIADPVQTAAGIMSNGHRTEVDLGGAPDALAVAELIVEDPVHHPAPCDALLFTTTGDLPPARLTFLISPLGSEAPLEVVDRNPIVIEQRPVDVAPTEAVECRGADANGTPPNRYGDAEPDVRAAEPIEVLRQFISAHMGTSHSGFVEMHEPDGTITYGWDAGAAYGGEPGRWSIVVHVDRDADGAWYLAGWTTSGC